MARLLVVHHTPSPHCQAMLEAVCAGARDTEITGVDVTVRPALSTTASDFLDADAYVLGSPVNLGYISGALKHAFDCAYYPILDATRGRSFGVFLHGNEGPEGAVRAIETITTGLGWERGAADVIVSGPPRAPDLAACRELGSVLAAVLMD
ncbi:flavodoxin family protein [Williamsia sp. CHRR-6]|uniref:flavodoxin family protein n=1 Tax=Williamsia sp. CHRR-6 TaxID=2835871 RepID=UPI001BDB120F|nr:flavodoxin family protein [Williamsia sp. CHRR-6]MBT0567876.1 flavodoxin family protein [Williamsia sp. CHRR-6]